MTSSPLPSPLRLAISGKMASGKSTLAAAVAALLGPSCLRVSFAGKIRAIIRELHGVARTKDRDLLTGIGMLHRRFDPGTWLNAVRREVAAAPGRPCVLDDLRFENELAGLRADGWILVRLVVGDAERGRRLRAAYGGGAAEGHHGRFAAHPSETGLDATPDSAFDLVVVDRGGASGYHVSGPTLATPTAVVARASLPQFLAASATAAASAKGAGETTTSSAAGGGTAREEARQPSRRALPDIDLGTSSPG